MNKKRVFLSVTNDLSNDQRVHKICESLSNNDFDVTLIGRKRKHSIEINSRNYKTKRFRLLFNKGFLFYACYNLRLFIFLLFSKYDILVANDLDTLPANVLAAKIRTKKLIYDSHELFTEVPELNDKPFVKKIWQLNEKVFIHHADAYLTVSEPIVDFYLKKYGIKFIVIRNLPLKMERNISVEERKKQIIYQGALNKDRGLETMIEAMQYVDDYVLLIAGRGDIEDKLKHLMAYFNLQSKVIFLGHVDINKLRDIDLESKLGLSLERDTCLNYRYALPNKIFDYINAGTPVLCSDLPEMSKIIKKYECGQVINNSFDAKCLANKINFLINDINKLKFYQNNCLEARKELNWENEKLKLLEIYKNI